MNKQYRSNNTIRTFRNRLAAAALTLASTVALAQAQTSEIVPAPEKRSASEAQIAKAAVVDSETSVEANATVVKPEASTGRFTKTPGEIGVAKNPFAKDADAKPAPPTMQSSGSDWQFAFAPYLYMTGVEGEIGARGRTAEIDVSFGDIFENLNLGIMGTFEARKNRFVFVSDLMWIKLGEERDTPGALFSSAKLGVNMFIFDPEAGYRIYEGKAGSFDVLGGVRIMSVETNLNFRTGILPGFDVSERKTWATPVIGAHGTLNLSPKFYLATKFDIGGGLGADFTGQFYGGAGYRIKPKIALVGGYRYLNTDYDSEAGFVYNANMNGIVLGAKFSF